MQAGKLRHRVTIQDKTVARDAYNGEVITWTTVTTVWAAVEPLNGREFLEAQRDGAQVTTRIRIRDRSVTPEMRVVFGSHVYDVESVIAVEERGAEVVLMCKELV